MITIKLLRTAFAFVLGTTVLLLGVATAMAQDYDQKQEKRDLKAHQKMERQLYGNSKQVKAHQRMEREQLQREQRLEREGYYVRHQQYSNEYGNYEPYYNNRYENNGYYDMHGHWHPYRRN